MICALVKRAWLGTIVSAEGFIHPFVHFRLCTVASIRTSSPRSAAVSPAEPSRSLVERLYAVSFWIYVGAIAFSLLGMLLLRTVPSSLPVFAPYYEILVKTPTWTYMTLMAVLPVLMYGPKLGARRMTLFVAWGSLIGAASELIGTMTGVPFGAYAYTTWMGPKIAGHVPYFIPLSWFAMSILSLDLAQRVTTSRWRRILLATVFMVLWDVSLDPAMGRFAQTTFWSYPGGGFYYGMPLSNWAGWFGVSLIIMIGYEWLCGGLPATDRRAPLVYGVNCLFPILLCLLYGLYLGFVAGLLAAAVPYLFLYAKRRSAP